MAQNIVDRYELDLPSEQLEHVLFLSDELLVAVWDLCEAQQLVDTGVSLLQVLGRDEDTREGDQMDDIVFRVALEMLQGLQMTFNICSEQVGIE